MPLVDKLQKFVSSKVSPRIVRKEALLKQVVFVGGHPGCGKTMLTPIVGSMDRVEIQKYNYPMEHMCTLYQLGRIDKDVLEAEVRMLLDLDLYNMVMARETNFRWTDLSSVFRNPKPWRYIKRLFQNGDAEAIYKIEGENPILHIVTHNLFVFAKSLFGALGSRATLFEVVRHPLYMIKQWFLYIDRYGNDARSFGIWYEYKGRQLPFFARGWEEIYINSNSMDRTIYSIENLKKIEESVMASLTPEQKSHVLTIPFESFVLNPELYLNKMARMLGTTVTKETKRECKKQNVPRKMIADGINRTIYKQYGWKPSSGASEQKELLQRRNFAAEHATREGVAVLDRLSRDYEGRYLKDHPDIRFEG